MADQECAFCRIGPQELVFADERTVAFLDHRPVFAGHCLLIPRAHYPTLADLPQDLLAPLFENARLLAMAMEEGLGAEGAFLAVNNKVSQSVPHLHVHVVPRRKKDGLRGFFWPRGKYEDAAQMERVRESLRAALGNLRKT